MPDCTATPPEPTQARPIFIIGAPRSGTSVLTWCLGQHSNIITVPETNWIAALASQVEHFWQLGSGGGFTTSLSSFRVTRPEFATSFGTAIDRLIRTSFEKRHGHRRQRLRVTSRTARNLAWLRSADDPKTRWVDGTPANTGYAGELARLFPEARFVLLVRNPDNVLTSLVASPQFSAHWKTLSEGVAYIYHTARAAYLTERALGPKQVLRVRFEDLIATPEREMRRILTFLDEPYEENCLAPLTKPINHSAPASKANHAAVVAKSRDPHLEKLRGWYARTADPACVLDCTVEKAADELGIYASIPINPPPPTRMPGA